MFETQEILRRLLLAVVLGAIVGLERDRNLRDDSEGKSRLKGQSISSKQAKRKFSFIKSAIPASGLGGLRTYILISLLGALSGIALLFGIEAVIWIMGGGLVVFVLISFILNYFDKNTFGLTTEISILVTFTLSLLLFVKGFDVRLIVAIYVFNAFILSMKAETKRFVAVFSVKEVMDTAKFALFSVVILQFLPDKVFGLESLPLIGEFLAKGLGQDLVEVLTLFNPYRLWLVVVLVSGINFVGYFLAKLLGKGKGFNILGLLGGLVSSTVVTEAMAAASRGVKDKNFNNALVHAAILANMTSFIRIFLVAAALNLSLAIDVALPMFVMSAFLLGWYLLGRGVLHKGKIKKSDEAKVKKSLDRLGISFSSPFSFGPALAFGGIYVLVLIFTKLALYYLGGGGFILSSMISSMSGLDAITVNTATLAGSEISNELGALVLVLAASVNLAVKALFAAIIGNRYFKGKIFVLFLITIVLGIGTLVATSGF